MPKTIPDLKMKPSRMLLFLIAKSTLYISRNMKHNICSGDHFLNLLFMIGIILIVLNSSRHINNT